MNKEEILNKLLELSEKHFSEGDYIIAASLLKDIHNRNETRIINEDQEEMDEQIINEINYIRND